MGTGTVYVISTPIGNLEDVSLRALRLLGEGDLLLAEDTRRARILLDRHSVQARPVSFHARNEESRIQGALESLQGGGSVVVISDAGTPLVSDPGGRLVRAAIADGHRVEAIPGASAVLASLVVSGLRSCPFVFLGFPPRKSAGRRALFEEYRHRHETLVLFESPRRAAATLRDLFAVLGNRRACLARELTKLHEEVMRGSLEELVERVEGDLRGEVSLVVEGCEAADAGRVAEAAIEDVDGAVRTLVALGRRPREVAADLAPLTGRPRRELYALAVAARESS